MTRRAFSRPGAWTQNLLIAAAMGSAFIMLGCGGGGGNGGPPPPASPCNVGDGSTVLCGYVTTGSGAAVSGATVLLKNNAGATVAQGTSGANGLFTIKSVPATATQFQVDPPAGPDYFSNTLSYKGKTYLYYTQNQAQNGPCIPLLPSLTANEDNAIGTMTLYLVNGGPPAPPINGCPR